MRSKLLLALILVGTALAQKPKPTAADFPKTMHIIGASSGNNFVGIVDGECMSFYIRDRANLGMLKLGDYPARDARNDQEPRHHADFDRYLAYELFMPDGSVRRYHVGATGISASSTCALPTS